MVRRYLLAGLFVMFLGAAGIVNAADTKVKTETNDKNSGFSVESPGDPSDVERFHVSGAGGVVISNLTTTERNNLVPNAEDSGMMIFNTTTGQFEGYDGNAWVSLSGAPASPSFACGTDQVQDADGNLYNTVLIDTQCWMAENLNVGTRIDSLSSSDNQTDNSIIEKYCYDNLDVNCDTYGGLYQWDEMMQYSTTEGVQGICPAGWHIPTDTEWIGMEEYLGMCSGAETSCSDTYGSRGTTQGFQISHLGDSGFQGLFSGRRTPEGTYQHGDSIGYYWTGTFALPSQADSRSIRPAVGPIGRSNDFVFYAYSVRCMKD